MKLIKKILNSVNSERKYIAVYKNPQKKYNKLPFRGYFLEIVSQVFIIKEHIFRRTKPLLVFDWKSVN